MKRMNWMLCTSCVMLCLVLLLAQNAQAQQGGNLKAAAAQYLATREPQLQQTADSHKRRHLLLYLAPAALSADEAEKAAGYARELMALGEELKSQPGFGPSNYGQATHVGNLVLGRIALAGGDIGKAKEYLLAAGRVPGSPTLKSFGPDMRLAKELIEKGAREVAIEYFDLCAKFWENQGGKLEQWKEVVRQGDMPNFGPNLGYVFDSWRFARDISSTP